VGLDTRFLPIFRKSIFGMHHRDSQGLLADNAAMVGGLFLKRMLRKLALHGIGILAAACMVTGCNGPAEAPKAAPGTVQILSVGEMHFSQSSPALTVKYQTTLKIDDVPALRKEADVVFERFRPQAEQQGLTNAILSANDVPHGFIFTQNSSYNFVYKKDPDGSWHCTNRVEDSKAPSKPNE
jgi:hypothetical protein